MKQAVIADCWGKKQLYWLQDTVPRYSSQQVQEMKETWAPAKLSSHGQKLSVWLKAAEECPTVV